PTVDELFAPRRGDGRFAPLWFRGDIEEDTWFPHVIRGPVSVPSTSHASALSGRFLNCMTHAHVPRAERTFMTASLFSLRCMRRKLAQIPVEGTAVDGADRMVIGIGMAGLGDPGGEIRAQRRGCGVVSALVGDLAQDPGEAACRHAAPGLGTVDH